MPKTQTLPFRKIPGHSKIFLDYLDLGADPLPFYRSPPTLASLEQIAGSDLPALDFPRRELAAILRRQNAAIGMGARTRQNIDDLERADCTAVVTGQQVGLFAGPMYTIYKALTAIHIADELSSRGVRAVPLFWMECEDHDLAEVTHITALDADSIVHRLEFTDRLFGDSRELAQSVGSRILPESIRQVVAEYSSFLPAGEFRAGTRGLLDAAYAPGTALAGAFSRLMAGLLGRYGLIFFDPSDAEAKLLAAPLFHRALSEAGEIQDALRERSLKLEAAGFHAQVSVSDHSIPLFFQDDGVLGRRQ